MPQAMASFNLKLFILKFYKYGSQDYVYICWLYADLYTLAQHR